MSAGERPQWEEQPDRAQRGPRRKSVVVAGSRAVGWSLLRQMLRHSRMVFIAADVLLGTDLVSAVTQHQPDVLLLAPDFPLLLPGVLRGALAGSPRSAVILVGDEQGATFLDPWERCHVAAYIGWDEVDEERLPAALGAALAGFHVAPSTTDVSPVLAVADLALSERDERIVRALLAECTEVEIARALQVSARRVRMLIAEIKRKFGVDSLMTLGVRAYECGYRAALPAEYKPDVPK